MKSELTPAEQAQIQRLFGAVLAMRKYQKKYFKGDSSAKKTAIFWENNVDNMVRELNRDLGVEASEPKEEKNSQGGLF